MTTPGTSTPHVAQYLPLLVAGDLPALLRLFVGEPVVDDPRAGRVVGRSAFEALMRATGEWLAGREARVVPVALTQAANRAVAEAVLHLAAPGAAAPIALPVAVAANVAPQGAGLSTVRVYYSTWPLTGGHQVRPPILAADPSLELRDVVGRYHAALVAGDAETIVHLFEPDGLAREPSGGAYTYQGRARLREFYSGLLADGGIRLEHCAAVDDGVRCALEYNAVAWGATALPPLAGLAVYERAPTGLLAAARIYDDVDPPQ